MASMTEMEMEIVTTVKGWVIWRFDCFSSLTLDRTSGTGDGCNDVETVRHYRDRQMKKHQSRNRLKLKIRLLRLNMLKATGRKRLQDYL